MLDCAQKISTPFGSNYFTSYVLTLFHRHSGMDNPDGLKLVHRHSVWMIRISVLVKVNGILVKVNGIRHYFVIDLI
jgi:hypothetical protein